MRPSILYRATLGLAAAAVARGARIFERSPVLKTSFTRTQASLAINGGVVTTRRIVVATGNPTPLFRALARHFDERTSYFAMTEQVPAKVRASLGSRDHVLRVGVDRSHRIRCTDDERLLVSGAESEPLCTTPSRKDSRTADGTADVRAVDVLSRHLGNSG